MIKIIKETEDLGETISEYIKTQGFYLQFGFGVPVIVISLLIGKMMIIDELLLNVVKTSVIAVTIMLGLVFVFRNRSIGISASFVFITYILLLDLLLIMN